jgi:prepilin-type N-terminal cleavage/methylation domain-containing protein
LSISKQRDFVRSQQGFTLIELLIYSALIGFVLLIIGGFLINSLTAERTVKSGAEATNSGQLVAQSVTKGVRDSSALDLTTPFTGSLLLRALIVDDSIAAPATAHCQAWYFGGGELRTTTSPSAIPVPADHAAVSGWLLLATGVEQIGLTPVFSVAGSTADITLQTRPRDRPPVLLETTAVSRQPNVPPTEVAALCF